MVCGRSRDSGDGRWFSCGVGPGVVGGGFLIVGRGHFGGGTGRWVIILASFKIFLFVPLFL